MCPGTRHCDVASGRCPEAEPCLAPDDCDPGRACQNFACVDACGGDEDCVGGLICDLDTGLCGEPERCAEAGDCLEGRVCDAGRCELPCPVLRACAGRQVCDVNSGLCGEPPECGADGDCAGARVCEFGACIDAQCTVHTDCADGECIDRSCVLEPARACALDGDCPGSLRCSALGACVPDGPCEADAGCGVGGARCMVAAGSCRGCLSDGDCPTAARCHAGRCELAGSCAADAECPGTRWCRPPGVCVPAAGCADDRMEGGALPPLLLARTYTRLTLCDGDEDRYRVEVPAGQWLRATVRHDPAAGDLSLAALAANGAVVASSDGLVGVESVVFEPAGEDRSVGLLVRGHAGSSPEYSVELKTAPGEQCMPDGLEGPQGNDGPDRAQVIRPGRQRVWLCPGEVDWLAVDLVAGSRMVVVATRAPGAGATLEVLSPDGEPLAETVVDGEEARAALERDRSGRVMLRLTPADPRQRVGIDLELTVSAAEQSQDLACLWPETVALGAPLIFEPWAWLPVRRFPFLCGRVGDVERVARFTLEQESRVDLRLSGAPDGASLALRQECADPLTDVACAAQAPTLAIDDLPLAAGTWAVIVRTTEGAAPTLEVTALPARCEDDASCPAGRVCEQERCVAACVDDLGCAGPLTCDLDRGHCVGPDVCSEDAECPGDDVCEQGVCFAPECAVHADCAVDCVDRRCADGPQPECRADADCAAPLRCLAGGQCLQAGACAADADCPPRAPVCAPALGRCVQCAGDGDCTPAEQCLYGACAFHGACAADADCPGGEVCGTNDRCNPSDGCVGDAFDLQASPPLLEHRTYSGLVLCDGDEDVYETLLPGEAALKVQLRHGDDAGDLAVTVSEGGVELGRSDGPGAQEELIVGARVAGRTLTVTVTGRRGASAAYTLDLVRLNARECPADPFEGPQGNDSAERATPLGLGSHALSLCPMDADWFWLELPAGGHVSAALTPSGAAESHTVALRQPDGTLLAEAVVGGEEWSPARELEADVATSGPYLLEVSSARADENLRPTLTVDLTAAPDGDATACDEPLPLLADEPLALPSRLPAAGLLPASCGEGGTGWVASFELEQETLVRLDAISTLGGVSLAVRAECVSVDSELVCGRDRIEGLRLPAGTWAVVVRAPAGTRPELLLSMPPD